MSHLELPCAECGHPSVATSVDALAAASKEHKRYHLWLIQQALIDAVGPLAGLLERPR